MILDFADEATEDIFHGRRTKAARRCLPTELWPAAQRKLDGSTGRGSRETSQIRRVSRPRNQ